MKSKWQCYDCGKRFKTKKDLIQHLTAEFDDAMQLADTVSGQLEDMGVKNPYKDVYIDGIG